jgi:hypothetical protein
MCCNTKEFLFLTIDHINNDGAKHRREAKFGSIYPWLSKNDYPIGFQVLCMNCNWAKAKNGTCPHKTNLDKQTFTNTTSDVK